MAQREGSPLSFGGAVHAAATAAAAQEAEEDSGELQALATQASLRRARKEATATKRAAAKAAKAPAGPDEARPGKKQRKEAKYWLRGLGPPLGGRAWQALGARHVCSRANKCSLARQKRVRELFVLWRPPPFHLPQLAVWGLVGVNCVGGIFRS